MTEKDFGDYQIAEGITDRVEQDLIDDKIAEATHRIAQERERLLAFALYKGYDGVDIHMKNQVVTGVNQFSHGFEYEAWEGEPPELERFGQGVRRYDFTALTKEEKRILLAKVGAEYEDWEGNNL